MTGPEQFALGCVIASVATWTVASVALWYFMLRRHDDHWIWNWRMLVSPELYERWLSRTDRQTRTLSYRLRRLRADVRGRFWLPCPACGADFGGDEWEASGFPDFKTPDGRLLGICKNCAALRDSLIATMRRLP